MAVWRGLRPAPLPACTKIHMHNNNAADVYYYEPLTLIQVLIIHFQAGAKKPVFPALAEKFKH